MKKIIFILCFILSITFANAQKTYTVNGETLQLKTEIDGNLDLLWNIIDGKYRYFVQSEDGSIVELTNTKGTDKKYQEEYKTTLQNLTKSNSVSTKKLKLTLYSLRNFVDEYNSKIDQNYTSTTTKASTKLRLGLSGGITNNPFVGNPDNIKVPLIVGELEIYEENVLPRHSGFLQVRRAFEKDDFKFSTTELSLGYRYRFINAKGFNIYGQVKFATLNFSNATIEIPQGATTVINEAKDTAFDVPFIFGVGADIKVGDSGFITLNYGELFSAFLDNQGNFSTDITLGYKFNL
jgi:hypothetical protein